jgi:LytS/YehU family sensor histidine kinase
MIVFVGALELARVAIRWAAGAPLQFWRPLDYVYEAARFLLFYALFGGIHFGLRSYKAWANERLRAEYQARVAQAAQLAQLTQQLQPHFLFNALNTVSSLIPGEPDIADALLTKLAALLRAATDAGQRPQQSLGDELALLRAYADIMVQRFADRAQVGWEIDERTLGCLVPTLGLQPLLENCFRHVVERRRAPTRISVRARRAPAGLHLEVEDDGDAPATPLAFGVGLSNLQQRLASLHGDLARLELEPRPGGGLLVRVELPCAC